MKRMIQIGAAAMLSGVAGCVTPPQQQQQVPLVAVPGPTKTADGFRQDDTTCRAAAAELPPGAGAPPVNLQPAASAASAPTDGQTATSASTAPAPVIPAGVMYLRCMAARNNVIEPLAPVQPALYATYPSYPVFVGYGDPYPWLYGDYVGFGFFGGYGGYRGGYGRYYGGYGRGFDHGGFHGGGGHGGFHH